jgi:LysM repeat protein
VPDTLHFLDHAHDTIASLSLRYNVPAPVLRRANNLTSDHLLVARRTIIVPGSHYRGGVSLSPRPIEGEEEEMRKGKIRRWMVATKVPEYDVAVFYLEQAEYDVEAAMEKYLDDERWERENPLDASSQTRVHGKGKGRATGAGSGQSIGDWRWARQRGLLWKT